MLQHCLCTTKKMITRFLRAAQKCVENSGRKFRKGNRYQRLIRQRGNEIGEN